ncbi:hypothetical protein ACT3R8_11530 [Halomonas sp. AOP42-C2-23]|nr:MULTISPECIES: hypothetical protein [Halomonas]|tara:strand:- start:1703 stop:1831 length:129 start_codon:yes stop_codon:yes gene_type:complete
MDFTPEPLDITLPPLDFTPPAIDLDTVPPFDVEPLPAKEAET